MDTFKPYSKIVLLSLSLMILCGVANAGSSSEVKWPPSPKPDCGSGQCMMTVDGQCQCETILGPTFDADPSCCK